MSLSRDSVLFPSEEYIQECIKNADRLREEWEKRGPKYLDMMAVLDSGVLEKVAPLLIPKIIDTWDVVWLPRLGQIIEMLEERGILWRMGHIDPLYRDGWLEKGLISERDRYFASKRPEIGDERRIVCYGPDPATALLRAYLEVMKEE